ncbi:MAG: type IV pilus assembly PilZ [Treponematales bacterium]
MKLMLIACSDGTYNHLSRLVKPLGFELIRYYHALKAMDNIDEVNPQALIISAIDFPMHWKTLAQFVRAERPKSVCPLIILTGESFPAEETAKARCLEVNGVLREALEKPEEVALLRNILARPGKGGKAPAPAAALPRPQARRVGFVFVHPESRALVTGKVTALSPAGLSFQPEFPALAAGLTEGGELAECSLRAGEAILSPVCRLVRSAPALTLEFVSLPAGEREILDAYLSSSR